MPLQEQITIQPTPAAARIALFGLTFMGIFGLGFYVLIMFVLIDNDAHWGAMVLSTVFMGGWIGTVIHLALYQRRVLQNRGEGLIEATRVTTAGDSHPEGTRGNTPPGHSADPIERIRALEQLRKDGLISDAEFAQKRQELMSQRW